MKFKKGDLVNFTFDKSFYQDKVLVYYRVESVNSDGTLALKPINYDTEIEDPVLPEELELYQGPRPSKYAMEVVLKWFK